MKKQNWKGIEPEGWTQSDYMACLECGIPLLVNNENGLLVCFGYKCTRHGLYTALHEFYEKY